MSVVLVSLCPSKDCVSIPCFDDEVRVIIFGSESKGFCAGADLAEEMPGSDVDGFVTEQIRRELRLKEVGLFPVPNSSADRSTGITIIYGDFVSSAVLRQVTAF